MNIDKRLQKLIYKLEITRGKVGGNELNQGREDVIAYLKERFPQYDFDVLNDSYIDIRLEEEQTVRIAVKRKPTEFLWTDYIEDVYENSGLVRIRSKNGEIRLNIKIPLYDQDTPRTKVCWRIDIKARNAKQIALFQQMRRDFFSEDNSKLFHKYGTRISMTDGKVFWLDRDDNGNYWIDIDEAEYQIEEKLPSYLVYLGHIKKST